MASSHLFLIAAAAVVSLLISPASSQTCKSQKFAQNTTFANCADLPTLNAFLHWTYDDSLSSSDRPTLSIAFVAPPASPNGWVAWALNPTGTGMVGAQALIAFRDTDGSVVVKTYSISSRSSIAESPISYQVLSKRAEFPGGAAPATLFATLVLPAGGARLNQVWQVGATVRNGAPVAHATSPENLSSKGTLLLESTAAKDGNAVPTAGGKSGGGPPNPAKRNANDNGGGSMVSVSGFWLYGVLVLIGVVLGF